MHRPHFLEVPITIPFLDANSIRLADASVRVASSLHRASADVPLVRADSRQRAMLDRQTYALRENVWQLYDLPGDSVSYTCRKISFPCESPTFSALSFSFSSSSLETYAVC